MATTTTFWILVMNSLSDHFDRVSFTLSKTSHEEMLPTVKQPITCIPDEKRWIVFVSIVDHLFHRVQWKGGRKWSLSLSHGGDCRNNSDDTELCENLWSWEEERERGRISTRDFLSIPSLVISMVLHHPSRPLRVLLVDNYPDANGSCIPWPSMDRTQRCPYPGWCLEVCKGMRERDSTVTIQILSNLVASNNISVEYIVEKPGANVDWGRIQVTVFMNRQLKVVI